MEVSLTADHVHVAIDHRESGLTPELTVMAGDHMLRRTAAEAKWDLDLGFTRTEPGSIQVLWRNADGVAVEGWRRSVPAGDYATDQPG